MQPRIVIQFLNITQNLYSFIFMILSYFNKFQYYLCLSLHMINYSVTDFTKKKKLFIICQFFLPFFTQSCSNISNIIQRLLLIKYTYEDITCRGILNVLAQICSKRMQFIIFISNNISIDTS